MENHSTIWIDLTMLISWEGQLTGIQRVEYNIAKRFAGKTNVKYFVFDKATKQLYPYNFDLIEEKIKLLNRIGKTEMSRVDIEDTSSKLMSSALKTVKKFTPAPIKSKIKTALKNKKNLVAINKKPIILKNNDVLLILSGDWSDNIFADMIFDLKTNKNLTIKVLQIIYDMLPSFYPQYFVPGMTIQFNTYMQKMLGICDEVFTISQSTKSDIIKFQATHNLPKITVDVFRLGEDFVRHDPIKPSFDLKPNKFILCVGTIESRKNHILLYYAMKDATTRNISIPPIIVVGKRGWLADNLFYIVENDPIMSKKLLFINNATDQELSWLFQNCLLTVYPSFCEGWGLPIAESLYYGKHCLSSNSSSMPEIAGDLIDYFSPYDPVAMLGLITTYTNKPTLLEQKELDIQKNYKPTSWDETFLNIEQVVNTYVV